MPQTTQYIWQHLSWPDFRWDHSALFKPLVDCRFRQGKLLTQMNALGLDATLNYEEVLTAQRLFGWHAALFPTGYSGMHKIRVAFWRDDHSGPMQIVSGPIGREKINYQAPLPWDTSVSMVEYP